jgi:hypothetical protein
MNHFTFVALTSLAILSSACDGAVSSPTSIVPPATFTLSGTVTEMTEAGPAPVEGALVSETHSGWDRITDADGHYSVSGLPGTSTSVSVVKQGYVTQTRTVTMNSDTKLDVQIERVGYHVLSGVVFEMTETGNVPIESVEIYCDSCGSPEGHTFAYTDANGFYSLAWALNGVHPLFVTKAGYEIVDPTGKLRDSLGRINAIVQGNTRFDIQMARR